MPFNPQEIQALLALVNRAPMTPAEQLYAQWFFRRLVAFCQPKPEPETDPEIREPGDTGKERKHA